MWVSLAIAAALLANPQAGSQSLAGARIAEAVEHALMKPFAKERPTVRIEVSGRVADQTLPAGEVSIEAGAIAGPWPRPRAGVPVKLKVDGRTMRTLTVWVDAHDPRTVLAYGRDYEPRQPASALEVREALVDMACCGGATVAELGEVDALRTRRRVRAGEPVMLGDFEPQPAINRQQAVEVEVVSGSVRLTARGIALGDGSPGDRIAVRVEPSQAVLHGRVMANHKVVVDE